THQRNPLARSQREGHMAKGPVRAPGVAEAHVLENEALADRVRHRAGVLGASGARLEFQESEEVAQEEPLLVDVRGLQQNRREDTPAAFEGPDEEGERAHRDDREYRLDDDERDGP